MSLNLYDTATREVNEFKPLVAGQVSMYICGATVSVYATTSDKMGFTGRGEGIYVIANALVQTP